MAESTQRRQRAGGRAILVFLALFMIVSFPVLLTYGVVAGEEFSPNNLKSREFWYFEIPLFKVQISPIFREEDEYAASLYLNSRGYIFGRGSKAKRWDLVHFTRGRSIQGDATILVRYLNAVEPDGDPYWVEWTKRNNRTLAPVLWPEVFQLADEGMYIYIPAVMSLAKEQIKPAALKKKIDRLVTDQYLATAASLKAKGEWELGITLLSKRITNSPKNRELLEVRAEFYDELGEKDKAAADRTAAESVL